MLLVPLLAQNNLNQNYLSVNVSPLSLSCSYEFSISKEIKILNKISAESGFTSYNELNFVAAPKISIEPRYYYDLEERESKNKTIKNNSANYLAIGTNYRFDYETINTNPNNIGLNNYFSVESKWGFKRLFTNYLFFDINIGIGVYFTNTGNWETEFGPAGTIKLGWIFN